VIRLNDITIQSGQTKQRGQQDAKDAKGKDSKTNPHSAASGQCGREGVARCISDRQPLRRRSGSWHGHGILANTGFMVGCGLVTALILIVILSLTAARRRIMALIWR
jgi:hypothetical protein